MHHSETQSLVEEPKRGSAPGRIDWPSWVMLAWMLGVLTLYTKMVFEERFPWVLAIFKRWLGQDLG